MELDIVGSSLCKFGRKENWIWRWDSWSLHEIVWAQILWTMEEDWANRGYGHHHFAHVAQWANIEGLDQFSD